MKKKNNLQKQQEVNNGFEALINVHSRALEDNSESIVEMLEMLQGRKLSQNNLKDIKFIKKELKRMDKSLDDLGKEEF